MKLPNSEGRPETWGIYRNNEFQRRLVIKPEASVREGLDSGSAIPRFDARLENGIYVNPFTGEVGNYRQVSHIPLENPYLKLENKLFFSSNQGGLQ